MLSNFLAKSGNSNSYIQILLLLSPLLFGFGFVFVVLKLKKILYSCLVGLGASESTCICLIQK